MRGLRLAGFALGVAVVVWLAAQADLPALLGAFARIGWGFAAILAVRGITIAIDAAAWRCLLPAGEMPAFAAMLTQRWIGEAINATLPAAQIGGEVVRARLLQRLIAVPGRAAAAGAVDFLLTLVAQMLFTLLGFVLLAGLGTATDWWLAAASATLALGVAALGWELLARRRVLAVAERAATRLGQRRLAALIATLAAALALIAADRTALGRSLALHLAGFIGHAIELWLTMRLMALSAGFADAALLESLSLAARSAAFLIPSGWGAQEASLVALAALIGLPPGSGLALGFVKRARELIVGLPGLAVWALIERRYRLMAYGGRGVAG